MSDLFGAGSPRLTVVYGATRFRLAYLGQLLQAASVLYLDLDGQRWHLAQLKTRLLAEQHHQASVDLASVNSVILDNCDATPTLILQTFIHETLSAARQIVVFYEHLPLDFDNWDTPMRVMRDSALTPSILPHTGSAAIPLKIEALRRGHVYLGETQTLITHWRGQLQRDVLYFIADKKSVDRDEVLATFWAHLAPSKAANNFFVTLGKLAKVLGFKPIVRRGNQQYGLAPQLALQYDVDDFVAAFQAGLQQTDETRLRFLEEALALYRAPFLEGNSDAWVVQRRQVLAALAVQALQLLAAHYQAQAQWAKALGYLSRAFYIDSTHEQVTHDLMTLYLTLTMPCDAVNVFECWQKAIKHQPEPSSGEAIGMLAVQAYQQCSRQG
jgi:DNA-binding SARP family transcriptional activator